MSETLPVLNLGEQHKNLLFCMREYPHITDVFQNVVYGRPLNHNIHIKKKEVLDFYIETFFVPLLLKNNVIAEDDSSPNNYRPLVSEIRSSLETMKLKEIANLAVNGMNDIVESIGPDDSSENTLTAFVHGEYPEEFCLALVEELRKKALELLNEPSISGSSARKLKLSLAIKFENQITSH